VTYTVTGGTGRFLGGGRIIKKKKLLDRRAARQFNQLEIIGKLSMPAVPEPASWSLMVGGFGLAGVAMRRRQRVLCSV